MSGPLGEDRYIHTCHWLLTRHPFTAYFLEKESCGKLLRGRLTAILLSQEQKRPDHQLNIPPPPTSGSSTTVFTCDVTLTAALIDAPRSSRVAKIFSNGPQDLAKYSTEMKGKQQHFINTENKTSDSAIVTLLQQSTTVRTFWFCMLNDAVL